MIDEAMLNLFGIRRGDRFFHEFSKASTLDEAFTLIAEKAAQNTADRWLLGSKDSSIAYGLCGPSTSEELAR